LQNQHKKRIFSLVPIFLIVKRRSAVSIRIGVCTGGGDCPGLNASIRAIVNYAGKHGMSIIGIRESINGLMMRPLGASVLTQEDVIEILAKGGTILGTHNSGNPLDKSDGAHKLELTKEGYKHLKLDGLVIIGGEGSQTIASQLSDAGLNVIGVPKTIDNELPGTEQTIGFASCIDLVADSVMKLQSTAESHDRVMILEVMGRDSGYIALYGGLAGGAHIILIPEIAFRWEAICSTLLERKKRGLKYSVIVVSEGALAYGSDDQSAVYNGSGSVLGGIGQRVAIKIYEKTQMETRVTVLGHLQRGGIPNTQDRLLATRFSVEAINLVLKREFGRVVVLKNGVVTSVPYKDIPKWGRRKISLIEDEYLKAAEAVGICLGR
jgi:6-phosphofructokinase 1